MKVMLVALSLCLAAPAFAADDVFAHPATPAQLRALLGDAAGALQGAQTLRGNYEQRKHLPELPQPLLATGDFLFVRDRGIRWRTRTPFGSELILTPTALVQRESGSEHRVGADSQPAIHMIGRIFLAVFALDFAALDEMFTLYGMPEAHGWRVGLKPRQATGSLKSIEVAGSARVERLLLREGDADTTEIELRDTAVSAAPPSPEDLAPFAQ